MADISGARRWARDKVSVDGKISDSPKAAERWSLAGVWAHWFFGVIAAVAVTFSGPSRAQDALEWTACPGLNGTETNVAIHCTQIVVPENWTEPGGLEITLKLAHLRANVPDARERQPVVYFEGGPGFHAIGENSAALPAFAVMQAAAFPDRDFFILEPRGTGANDPSLNCQEQDDAVARLDLIVAPDGRPAEVVRPDPAEPHAWASFRSLIACRDRLTAEGVDLAQYTSTAVARDGVAVLDALGLDQVVALGVSFGARYAVRFAQIAPERTEAVVLDSPSLFGTDFHEVARVSLPELVAFQSRACALNVSCRLAVGDFQAQIAEVAEALATEKLFVPVEAGPKGQAFLEFDGFNFFSLLSSVSYAPDASDQVRSIVRAVDDRDLAVLSKLVAEQMASGLFDPHLDEAVYWSVMCSDDRDLLAKHGPDPDLPQYLKGWERVALNIYTVCAAWPFDDAMRKHDVEQPVDVPVLVLNYEADVATPASLVDARTDRFPKLVRYIFPGPGHAALWWAPCAAQVTALFLRSAAAHTNSGSEACPEPSHRW